MHNVDIGMLDDSADLDAKLTETHYNRAFGYFRLGEFELATKAAQAALEINRSYPLALSLLELIKQEYFFSGLTSIKENEISKGICAFQSAVDIDPTFMEAYYEIGCAYLRLNELDEAEKAAEKVLELDSEAAHELLDKIKRAYYARGGIYLSQDRLERAKTEVEEALRIDSDYKPALQILEELKSAYYARGLNFLSKNQYDIALTTFEALLSIDRTFAEAHCGIAQVYFIQDKFEAAGEAVNKALHLDSNYESARELLKKIKYAYCDDVFNYLNKNQYNRAIIFFEDTLAVDTDYMEAKWEEALAYLEQGELGEAERVINQVLGFSSNYRFNLDYWFDSDHKFDSDYGFACALLEKIKHVYYDRGITALDQNQYDQAIINFENAIAIDAGFSEACIGLQNAYLGFEGCYLRQLEVEASNKEKEIIKRISEHIELLAIATQSVQDVAYLADETGIWEDHKKSYQDKLKKWLWTVSLFPLLTREEEVELAKRIEAGETEDGYTADAEQARDLLVQANLRLVIVIARKFQGPDIPIQDLIQEGNIGLIKAASKFDYRWGHRFSSYASWWVRQAMAQALNTSSRLIRLPSYFIARMKKYDTVYAILCQELQREPYREEIAEVLDLTVEQVEEILTSKIDAVSMDSLLGDEYSVETLGDLMEDLIEDSATSEQEGPIAKMVNEDLIDQFLKRLPDREQEVVKLRFGLEDGKPKTLREVGLVLEITRERVRQLEKEVIKRLRVLYDEIGEYKSNVSWAGKL